METITRTTFSSRHREESAPWSCSRARLAEPAVLARVQVAEAARKALPVPRETAARLLKAARRRSPALSSSSNRAVRHPASNSSSRHSRRKASNNVDDIPTLTRTDAYPFYSPEWPRRRFDILSRREGRASSPTTSSSREAKEISLPPSAGEGFHERECTTRRLWWEDAPRRQMLLRVNSPRGMNDNKTRVLRALCDSAN